MGCHCCDVIFTRKQDLSYSQQNLSFVKNLKLFSYNELRSATENFHQRNKIGQGGFGMVYKGILKDGNVVAAKVLSAQSKQGVKEFLTEIDIITNVRHPNLVALIGCCVHGTNRILVYEYLEKTSLDHALLSDNSERATLDWGIRSMICVGTAMGLKFLHEEILPHIVHRDIKASNILLDTNFIPKIGDFGLAKLFADNISHISTRVAGTIGYLAPEYAMQGQLTKKADVYSFGVLLLEIVSGRSNSKEPSSETEKLLLEWTWQLSEEGRLREVVDPVLQEYPEEEVLRYIKVGLFCTQAIAQRRPSMLQVVEMLSKPMRLDEKGLKAPSLFPNSARKNNLWRARNSSTPRFKGLLFASSSNPGSSAPITFSEMLPR